MTCGILVPPSGIKPTPLALKARNLNHWMAREVSLFKNFNPACFKVSTIFSSWCAKSCASCSCWLLVAYFLTTHHESPSSWDFCEQTEPLIMEVSLFQGFMEPEVSRVLAVQDKFSLVRLESTWNPHTVHVMGTHTPTLPWLMRQPWWYLSFSKQATHLRLPVSREPVAVLSSQADMKSPAPATSFHILLALQSESVSCSARSDSLRPQGLTLTRLLCSWDSPGKNPGAGCHALLQGIFPTQGLNPGLPHSGQTLQPEPPEKPSY